MRPSLSRAIVCGAAVNVAIGVAIAFDPSRSVDFDQVVAWSRMWIEGRDPYLPADSIVDYPPSALVALSPLALMSKGPALAAWVAINVVLAAVVARMTARPATDRRAGTAVTASLVLLLPPFRTLVQFSLASFAAALAGFRMAAQRPRAAGVLIGVSLIKPHVGGPALLWALAARRWQTVIWACATQGGLWVAYLLRAWQSPLALVENYADALQRTQNRDDLVGGVTSLQPLVDGMPFAPVALQAGLAIALAAGLAVIAWTRRDDADFDLRFYGAAGLVSLLAFRHLSYNLLLAIPALAWTLTHHAKGVRAAGCLLGVSLIASPPTAWRVLAEAGMTLPGGLAPLADHAYRSALAALFALALWAGPASGREGR